MALFTLPQVSIAGISACVPKNKEHNLSYEWISPKEREMLVKTTGIEYRRVANLSLCTSDMCFLAAQQLLTTLKWDSSEIDLLIFVSQSPDYFLPSTSIILQDRLGLGKQCLAFDIALGCSGYVYGLSVVAGLMQSGGLRKALLLVGDKSTSSSSYKDKSVYPLFGDAGTATALYFNPSATPFVFNLQSDGSGKDAIMISDGGMRNPINEETYIEQEIETGIIRHRRHLALNGLDVFNFSLREVVPNINALLHYANKNTEEFDYFIFHQANKLMNETIRKKMKLLPEKVPYSLNTFGNTSSASIPLTIVHCLTEITPNHCLQCLLSGFGVGLSWGSAVVEFDHIVCPPVIEAP